jgi:hypothetical protein
MLDVNVDLVDLELADVDVDVRFMTGIAPLEVAGVQACGASRA